MFRYLLYSLILLAAVFSIGALFKDKKKGYAADAATLSKGKELFTTYCISCHGLQHDGMGPRLGGVTGLLPQADLLAFIRDPAGLIASGNDRAVALHARYRQIMPAYGWMDDAAIHSILSYIDAQSIKYGIEALPTTQPGEISAPLTGPLVSPPKKSGVKIELEEVVQIQRLSYSSPDLGIVTMRSHPSGNGRLFVSDQGGVIYEIANGKAEKFLDMRDHVAGFSIGPGLATGLGSFDFHPDFLDNGLIHITHAEKYNGEPADYQIGDSLMAEVQWVLGEWRMDDITDTVFEGSWRELLRLHAPTFGHGAQDLAFIPGLAKEDPDFGLLYWGFGDGGSNNIRRPELGHHPKSFLGTILRIDPDGNNSHNGKYGIPPDNPFAKDTGAHVVKEIFAYGFRNPHRIAWDPSNGNRMIVTDIGEANIEEINIVEAGGDYGWPNREGDFGIDTKKDLKTVYKLPQSDLNIYKRPFIQYDHRDGFAVSGGYVYEGEIEILKNKYIFGDIVNGRLFYVNIDGRLTDSTVYEIAVVENGKETTLREMSGIRRLHLRIGYDRIAKALYVMTKADGRIKRVVTAY